MTKILLWILAIPGVCLLIWLAAELYAAHLQSIGVNPFN